MRKLGVEVGDSRDGIRLRKERFHMRRQVADLSLDVAVLEKNVRPASKVLHQLLMSLEHKT